MRLRYPAALVLTSLAVLAAAPHANRPRPAEPSSMYSARALRRARTILQLRLLELRKAKLERVRKAIERGIPIDRIMNDS